MRTLGIKILRMKSRDELGYLLLTDKANGAIIKQAVEELVAKGCHVTIADGVYTPPLNGAGPATPRVVLDGKWKSRREIGALFSEGPNGREPHEIAAVLLDGPATFKDPWPPSKNGMQKSPTWMRNFLKGLIKRQVTWEQLSDKEFHTLEMGADVYNRERDARRK